MDIILFMKNIYNHLSIKKIKLCEIGILCGDKLVIFDKYFLDVTLYGYDINIDIIKKTQPKDFLDKINIKKLNSKDNSQTKLIKEKFDIIIDDGCHRLDSIKKHLIISMKN